MDAGRKPKGYYIDNTGQHPVFQPDWDSTFTYNIDEVIAYAGSVYKCIQAGKGKQPDIEPTYWEKTLGAATVDGTSISFSSGIISAVISAIVPPGVIWEYGGAAAPTGFLMCDGGSYLRSAYPGLFTVIGTTFGYADGTHFNVPNMLEAAPVGVGSSTHGGASAAHDVFTLGQFKDDQLGNHTHAISDPTHQHGIVEGNVAGGGNNVYPSNSYYGVNAGTQYAYTGVTVSGVNSGRYGDVSRGKRLGLNFIIKT